MKLLTQFLFKKSVSLIILILFFLSFQETLSQTIAATNNNGSSTAPCGACAPSGWSPNGGTPDRSTATTVAGPGGGFGAGETWNASPLPLPPNNHTNWITVRDVGSLAAEEAVSTTMGNLIVGQTYELIIYALSSLTPNYSPQHIDFYQYQIQGLAEVSVSPVSQNVWQTNKARFVATATSMTFEFTPGNNMGNNISNLESVNLSISLNAVNTAPVANNNNNTTFSGVPVSFNITNNDSDAEDTTVQTATVDLNPSTPALDTSVSVPGEGTWTVDALGNVTFSPLAAFTGTATLPYTVQDNYMLDGAAVPATSNTAQLSVVVTVDPCDAAASGNLDTDGDGISDICDVDDDNDGILDSVECPTTNASLTGTAGASSTLGALYSASKLNDDDINTFVHTAIDASASATGFIEIDLGQAKIINQIEIINRVSPAGDRNRLANVYVLIADTPFPTDPNDLAGSLSNADFTFQLASNETGDPVIPVTNVVGRYVRMQLSGNNVNTTGNPGQGVLNIAELRAFNLQDTDGDLIPDCLDTDSDNDGCPDAIEGAENIVLSQLLNDRINYVSQGGLDAQGVPNAVSSGGQGQGLGSSADSNVVVCCDASDSGFLDTDNDDVSNICDVDDDNDGILDSVECPTTNASLTGTAGASSTLGALYSASKLNDNDINTFVHTAIDASASATGFIEIDLGQAKIINQIEIINRVSPAGDRNRLANVYVLIADTPFPTDPNNLMTSLSNADFTFQLASDETGDPVIPVPSVVGRYVRMQLSGNNVNTTGNPGQGVLNIAELRAFNLQDTDGDLIPNCLDTDSDNDGCPDAVEAAGSFLPTQLTALAGGSNGAGSSLLNFGTTVNTTQGNANYGLPIQDANGLAIAANMPQATATAVTSTAINACQADLSLTKKVDKAIVKVGDTIIYTLTVKNDGSGVATGVQVTDALPAGITYVSDNSATTSTTYTSNVWNVGDLNVNQTKSLQITATVSGAGTIVNTSQVTQSNQTDPDATPNNGN